MKKTIPKWLKRSLAVSACTLLLAGLGYSSLATLSAMADSPRLRAPAQLVLITYEDHDDVQRLAGLELHWLDWQPERLVLALVSPQELAALRSLGFDVQVLDAPATPDLYYLVAPPAGETAWLQPQGQIFPYAKNAYLLKAEPAEAERFAIHGFFIHKLLGPIVLPSTPPAGPVDATSRVALDHDPLIQELVDSVSETNMVTTIRNLQDDDALPGWDAERSRFSYAPELAIERDYIHDQMAGLGLDVRYQNFNHLGWSLDNIEATLDGWGPGSDLVYIVCAHYDSISQDPNDAAPGADDNASGVAAVLEAARLLSQYRYRHTLRFVTFAAEEQGLIGSYHYVSEARSGGTDIGGAINLDMIAWDSNDDDLLEIHAGTRADSQALGSVFLNANTTYGLSLATEFLTFDATYRSDHARFWSQGYPAMLAIEDFEDFNPHYHRTSDTLDNLDLPYATKFVKGTIATLAELAEIIPPGLNVEHTGPETVAPGGLIRLVVDYANPGPNPATGVVISNTLSPGLTYVGDNSGFPITRPHSGTIVWQVGDAAPHVRNSFVVTAAVEAALARGAGLTSTVQIAGITDWDDPMDNQATWTWSLPYRLNLPVVFKNGN